jgi:hypothetical protein
MTQKLKGRIALVTGASYGASPGKVATGFPNGAGGAIESIGRIRARDDATR